MRHQGKTTIYLHLGKFQPAKVGNFQSAQTEEFSTGTDTFRVHTTLGPGLLESVYQTVLAYELGRRGLRAVSQQAVPVVYDGIRIDTGFRADLVVEDKVIVEIKSVEVLLPVHKKQLLTYLRLADKRLGLLINFQVALIKDGITRIVNGLEDDDHAKSPSRKDA